MAAFVAHSAVKGMDNSPGWGGAGIGWGRRQRQRECLRAHSSCPRDLRAWLHGHIHLVGTGISTAPKYMYFYTVIHTCIRTYQYV